MSGVTSCIAQRSSGLLPVPGSRPDSTVKAASRKRAPQPRWLPAPQPALILL